MSAAHFQFPSVCFSQTSRYFPRSLIGLPLASFIVNSYVPLTHAISPDLPTFTMAGCQVMTRPGAGEHVFPAISNRLLRRRARRVWGEHDRIVRIEGDCLLDIFSCCRFRPVCIETTKKSLDRLGTAWFFAKGDDCEIESGSSCERFRAGAGNSRW